ncbi:MAG: galactokinase [Woeseiaceae bacterium]
MTLASQRLSSVADQAANLFAEQFGTQPTLTAFAPGRVNLIGEHTDYTDGLSMPFAIDRYLVMAARLGSDDAKGIRLRSTASDDEQFIDLTNTPVPSKDWSTYVRGVIAGLTSRGIKIPAMDILVHSTIPAGAGLSSSAALEVAAAHLLLAASGHTLAIDELVLLAQKAEHEFANVPCGMMDQFSVANGRAGELLLFDSRDLSAKPVPMQADGKTFLVIDSQVNHALSDGAYAERRRELETVQHAMGKSLRDASLDDVENATDDIVLRRRGRHVVTENQRVRDMAQALAQADWKSAGSLLFEGHASLRDDFETSCSETDLLVALGSDLTGSGLIGARMTGGGFGGSVIALVEADAAADIGKLITERYQLSTGLMTTPLFVTPSAGAGILTTRNFQ